MHLSILAAYQELAQVIHDETLSYQKTRAIFSWPAMYLPHFFILAEYEELAQVIQKTRAISSLLNPCIY